MEFLKCEILKNISWKWFYIHNKQGWRCNVQVCKCMQNQITPPNLSECLTDPHMHTSTASMSLFLQWINYDNSFYKQFGYVSWFISKYLIGNKRKNMVKPQATEDSMVNQWNLQLNNYSVL